MKASHLKHVLCATLIATFLLTAPTGAVALSASWTDAVPEAGYGCTGADFVWPNVVWIHGLGGITLRNLESNETVELASGVVAYPPVCSDAIVAWSVLPTRDSTAIVGFARSLDTGVETVIPIGYCNGDCADASGSRIATFRPHVAVYDCESGTEIFVSHRLSGSSVGAIQGDRVAWVQQLDGSDTTLTIHVRDLATGQESVVATSSNSISALDLDGDRLVYSAGYQASPQLPAVHFVDLVTGEQTELCVLRYLPRQISLQGDKVIFDYFGISVFNLRTRTLSTAGMFSGAVYWAASGTRIAVVTGGVVKLGSLDVEAPSTTSDVQARYLSHALVRLTAHDDIGDPANVHTFYRLDGAQAAEGTTVAAYLDRDHVLEFWSVDEMGNEELPHQQVEFTVDRGWCVTARSGPNGAISPAGLTTLTAGSDCTYTVTPSAGYHVADVLVDGVSVGPVPSYVFADVVDDHTIIAAFGADPVPRAFRPVAPGTIRRHKSAAVYGLIPKSDGDGEFVVSMRFYRKNSAGKYVFHHSTAVYPHVYSSTATKYDVSVSLPHAGRWRVRTVCTSPLSRVTTYSAYDYIRVR